jgi:hypothetical protein
MVANLTTQVAMIFQVTAMVSLPLHWSAFNFVERTWLSEYVLLYKMIRVWKMYVTWFSIVNYFSLQLSMWHMETHYLASNLGFQFLPFAILFFFQYFLTLVVAIISVHIWGSNKMFHWLTIFFTTMTEYPIYRTLNRTIEAKSSHIAI